MFCLTNSVSQCTNLFPGFLSCPFICISVFMSALYLFDYWSFVIQSEDRESDSSITVFLKTALIWGYFVFPHNFFVLVKNAIGNLKGVALNL